MRTVAIFLLIFIASQSISEEILLFSPSKDFHGCLNCKESNEKSVCNRYGKFGSVYRAESIWNPNGIGNMHMLGSPFNLSGMGLRLSDTQGYFHGYLSIRENIDNKYSKLLQFAWIKNENDYAKVRMAFCSQIELLGQREQR